MNRGARLLLLLLLPPRRHGSRLAWIYSRLQKARERTRGGTARRSARDVFVSATTARNPSQASADGETDDDDDDEEEEEEEEEEEM
jgi:hypothetical protein